jgi:hypothetical protein
VWLGDVIIVTAFGGVNDGTRIHHRSRRLLRKVQPRGGARRPNARYSAWRADPEVRASMNEPR